MNENYVMISTLNIYKKNSSFETFIVNFQFKIV